MWNEKLSTPKCEVISPDDIVGFAHIVANFDLRTVSEEETKRMFKVIKFEATREATVTSLALWFTVSFSSDDFSANLDTGKEASCII